MGNRDSGFRLNIEHRKGPESAIYYTASHDAVEKPLLQRFYAGMGSESLQDAAKESEKEAVLILSKLSLAKAQECAYELYSPDIKRVQEGMIYNLGTLTPTKNPSESFS